MASSSVFSSNKSAIDPDPSVIGGGGVAPPVHPNNDWTARYPYASGDYTNNLVGSSFTNNGTTATVDGVRGDVASFDGINDTQTSLYSGNSSGAATWALWINTNNLIQKIILGNASSQQFVQINNATTILIRGLGGGNMFYTIGSLSINTWYYLTITRNISNAVNVFINDTVSSTGPLTITQSMEFSQIGANQASQYWTGEAALPTYWDRDMSASAVTDNYNFELLPQP